jgi:DNA-directed RNA polymerase subunit RPC12/RpoP
MTGYYCKKCNSMVKAFLVQFLHPHLGIKTCYVCSLCGAMVHLVDIKEEGIKC